MLKLTNALTSQPLYLNPSYLLAFEPAILPLTTEIHGEKLSLGEKEYTQLTVGGMMFYVKESAEEVLEALSVAEQKAVQRIRKLKRGVEREDWQGDEE
jgi:hypothetical protein